MQVARRYLAVDKKKTFSGQIGQRSTILRRNRIFYPKSSLLSSFSATENEHLLFGFSTKIMSEKYSFECVKFYTSCFF